MPSPLACRQPCGDKTRNDYAKADVDFPTLSRLGRLHARDSAVKISQSFEALQQKDDGHYASMISTSERQSRWGGLIEIMGAKTSWLHRPSG